MNLHKHIYKLKGKVQHYAWGGYDFIPALLNIDNITHRPYAEYWMGAHPSASSELHDKNNSFSLHKLIEQHPEKILNRNVANNFGELPYLFKVLDVREMLSIQVHPSKTEAVKGFEAEDALNISLTASHRNYKDKNHKPEIMVALSEFWLLHGFKQKDKLVATLESIEAFHFLVDIFKDKGYKALYKTVMEMPQTDVDTILTPLIKDELQRFKDDKLTKADAGWWVSKMFQNKNDFRNIDRGIFSIYFFNIVRLEKGEAIFQGAGVPHAYLLGQNVELMANSDNVLRGGLTPKHIDVPELMKHVSFEGVAPDILKGDIIGNERIFNCPVPDFGISSIELKANEKYHCNSHSLEILLVMEGSCIVNPNNIELTTGESAAILANTDYIITALDKCKLYKAFVPIS